VNYVISLTQEFKWFIAQRSSNGTSIHVQKLKASSVIQ